MPRVPGGMRVAPRATMHVPGRTVVARQGPGTFTPAPPRFAVGSTFHPHPVGWRPGFGKPPVPGAAPAPAPAPAPVFTPTSAPAAPSTPTPTPPAAPTQPQLPWDTQGLLGQSGLLGAAQTADAGFDAREHSIYNRYGLNPDGTPTSDPYSISAMLKETLRKDRDALVQSQYAAGHGLDGSALLQGAFQGQDQARRTADMTRAMLDAIGGVEGERSAKHSDLLGQAAGLVFNTADNAGGDQTYTGDQSTKPDGTPTPPAAPLKSAVPMRPAPPQGSSSKTLTVKAKAKPKARVVATKGKGGGSVPTKGKK